VYHCLDPFANANAVAILTCTVLPTITPCLICTGSELVESYLSSINNKALSKNSIKP
jgi:hypothetical protein